MRNASCLTIALALIGLVPACGGADATRLAGDADEGSTGPGPLRPTSPDLAEGGELERGLEVIAEVTVEGATHRFLDANGAIVVAGQGHLADGTPVLAQLQSRHGPLTSLEIFLALAPEGAVVDERLIRAHAEEVTLLGRADDSVLSVDYVPAGTVEKSETNCALICANIAFFAGNPNPQYSEVEHQLQEEHISISNQTPPNNRKAKAVAVCNNAALPARQIYGQFDTKVGFQAWQQNGPFPVPQGQYLYWYFQATPNVSTRLRSTGAATCENEEFCEWQLENQPYFAVGRAY